MPRTLKDAKIESHAARVRLPVGRDHWKTLEPGRLHIGYRRKSKDAAGLFLARRYKGGERYQIAPLGVADDLQDSAPGILSYAEAARAAHAHTWDSPAAARRRLGGPTVADVMTDYIAYLREHKATAHDAEIRARLYILPRLGNKRVGELTTGDISDWLKGIADSPAMIRGGHRKARAANAETTRARRASANRVFTTLRAALNRAFREGHVDDDKPWRRVRPYAQTDAQRPGFLSLDECQRLINAADAASGFRDLVHAALLTGARYGELCNVRVRDVVNGKLHIARSKSGRSRNVTLTEEGTQFFRQLAAGRAGSEFLLLRSGLPFKQNDQSRPLREACERARIDQIGIHQLRHTYCSLSVMSGMPMQVLAQNLGHTTTRMIERHYSHLRDNYIDDAIRAHAPRFGMVEPSNVTPFARSR